MAFSIRQALSRWFPIQRGEGARVLLAAAANFLVMGGVMFGRNARDSLFLKNFGIQYLPYMYAVSALLVVACAVVYSGMVDRIDRKRFLTVAFLAFCGLLLVARLALTAQVRWFYPILYMLVQVIWLLSVMVFWTCNGDLFDIRQAKRLCPVVAMGGLLSMIATGFVTRPLVRLVGSVNLFVVWMAMLVGALLLLGLALQRYRLAPAGGSQPSPGRAGNWVADLREGMGHMFGSRLLRAMAGITLTLWVVFILVDFQFNQVMNQTYPKQDELTSFLGMFRGLAGFGALLVQLVLTPWMISAWGLGATIAVHPTLMLLSTGALFLVFGYPTAFFAKFIDHVLIYTLQESSFQLLYNPVPTDRRGRVRAFLEGYFKPVMMGVAGLILVAGNRFLSVRQITFCALVAAALWLYSSLKVRRAYVEALVANLGGENVAQRLSAADALAKLKDPDSLARLADAIRTAEPASAVLAMQFLERFGQPEAHHLLLALLNHETPHIRATAVGALGRLKRQELVEHLVRLLEDPDPRVRANAAEACVSLKPSDLRGTLERCLDDPADRVRANAIAALAQLQEISPSELLPRVEEMCRAPIEDRRAVGAYALSRFPSELGRPLLLELLKDPKMQPRLRAIRSLATVGDAECVPPLLEMMSGLTATRREGRQALLAIAARQPEETFAQVVRALDSESLAVRMSAVYALGRLERAEAFPHLAGVLSEPDPARREGALNSIEKLAARHALLLEVRPALEKCAWEELTQLEENLARMKAVESLDRTAETRGSVVEAASWLGQALASENRQIGDRIFRAAALLYDTRRVREVAHGLADGDTRKRGTALEALEYVIPGGLGKKLVTLLETETAPAGGSELRFPDVLLQLAAHGNPAVRACTVLLAGAAQVRECAAAVQERLLDPTPMVREVAVEASWNLLGSPALPRLERLRYDADPRVSGAAERVLRVAARQRTLVEGEAQEQAQPILFLEGPMLLTVEKVLFLKSVPLFAFLEGEELASVAEIAEEMEVEAATAIFREGETGDELYVIVSGNVRVYGERAGAEVPLAQLAERECFGEMALLDAEPRSASVASLEHCRLLKIRGEDFRELLHERPQISLEILKILARRLRRMDVEMEARPAFDSAQQYM